MNYDVLWESIEKSSKQVMEKYLHLQCDETSSRLPSDQYYLPFCCIPKILGFDYILTSSENLFLLEVNRFPGLESRSLMDSTVKHTVVYDAWAMAADRIGMPKTLFRNIRPPKYKGSSLNKLI